MESATVAVMKGLDYVVIEPTTTDAEEGFSLARQLMTLHAAADEFTAQIKIAVQTMRR